MIISKLTHITQRTLKELKNAPKSISEFGLKISSYIAIDHIFLRPKSEKYIDVIYKYTEKVIKPVIDKYNEANEIVSTTSKKNLDKIPVWVCWFQGKENMPELVNLCYDSICANVPSNVQVHLITLDNLTEYINIKPFIEKKFKDGIITNAFFSDIIRYLLLRDYGGMWIDATIYVSDNIPNKWFDAEYYTMKMPHEMCLHEVCKGKWTNFCFSGKANNIIFEYVCDALEFYLKEKNSIPDYVFLDYILMAGYRNIPEMKKIIDDVEYNNEFVWKLKNVLEEPYDDGLISRIFEKNVFHKLAHQVEYQKNNSLGELTFYGYLCKSDINLYN
jgi:hypothetical protein